MKPKLILTTLFILGMFFQSFTFPEHKAKKSIDEVWIFNYHRQWMSRGCTITADFYVAITVDIVHRRITAIDAGITNGTISCPYSFIIPVDASGQFSGDQVTDVTLISNNNTWNNAASDNKPQIVSDVNNDLNNSWGSLK